MTQANPKFVMERPMLTIDALKLVGKSCLELHNYYINNYNKGQDKIVSYKNQHFLMGDGIFLISWSDLYDLGCLSNVLFHNVSPQKLASSIYILNMRVICV
jgi:hypothetical protein